MTHTFKVTVEAPEGATAGDVEAEVTDALEKGDGCFDDVRVEPV